MCVVAVVVAAAAAQIVLVGGAAARERELWNRRRIALSAVSALLARGAV